MQIEQPKLVPGMDVSRQPEQRPQAPLQRASRKRKTANLKMTVSDSMLGCL